MQKIITRKMLKLFSNFFWFYLPAAVQKNISHYFSIFFQLRISRLFILPYCFLFGLSSDYLQQFESESGESNYSSYSDFFTRKYRVSPTINSNKIWPCEGYICDWGYFTKKEKSIVKGQKLDLNSIFSTQPNETPNYFFVNIFLHNHNYHRVHSPTSGTLAKITHIPGKLIFLRPWFYQRSHVSYPAFQNERVIFEIRDHQNRSWHIALVGGFGVGTIKISHDLYLGAQIQAGHEIAHFRLGSTVCLAIPNEVRIQKYLAKIQVGEALQVV